MQASRWAALAASPKVTNRKVEENTNDFYPLDHDDIDPVYAADVKALETAADLPPRYTKAPA